MNGLSSYRDNPLNWSLPLCKVYGIRIRLHLLFILWIIFQLFRSLEGSVAFTAAMLATFFVVVLIHEFGHCFGARFVGGDAHEVLMWPLGGLATVDAPMNPRAQFITTAAGPAVNVVFCVLCAIGLLLFNDVSPLIPLNPFRPFALIGTPLTQWGVVEWLCLLWGVNYIILLFNLLPTFPMDGGRMLQALLWPAHGYRRATMIATFVGMIGAVVFGLIGLISDQIILVCIAVFGYITCMQQRYMLKSGMFEEDNEFGYDFSKGHQAFEQKGTRVFSWRQRRRQARQEKLAQRQRKKQEALEQQIDAILDKVHREGIHSLTRQEKKILEAGTARKKNS